MIKYSFLVLPIEKLLERAGNAETYQIRCLILFSIQWLFSSIIFFGYRLLLLTPPIHCYNNSSPDVFQCTEEEACSGIYFYRFDIETVDSLVSEFNLICERKIYVQLCEYAFYIGAFLGALYYTTVIQNKGRFFVITQTTTLIGTMLLISLVSVHIYINAIVFFMVAFALFGLLNASVNYFVEISGGALRLLGPNCFLFGWGFGQLFLSIFSKTYSGWQAITFCIMGIPMIIIALFFRFMKESPRFLVTQEKFEDAKNSLRNIAKINGRSMPDFSFESEMRLGLFADSYMFVQNDMKQSVTPAQKKQKSILTLFRYETLKTSAWVILAFWVILTVDSHGNKLSLDHFADDIHESLILTGIAQMFGYLLSCYFATNSNRRPVIGFSFLAVGLVYLIFYGEGIDPNVISVETDTGLTIMLLIIGKVSACLALGTLYNVVVELFPTNVRHFSFGLFYCGSQLALFLLMLLEDYGRDVGLYGILILGIVNVVLVFVTRYMDETDKRITDYIREEDELLLSFELREREQ